MNGQTRFNSPGKLYLAGLLVYLLLTPAGCATPARPTADTATTPAALPTLTAAIAQVNTPPAVVTATSLRPSPTPTLPAVPPAGDGGPSSPLQLEPTATATTTPLTPLTPSPTVTPVPTSAEVDGWLVYENDLVGYRFSYPPEATINRTGTPGDFDDLCGGVRYKTGFVAVFPRDVTCGITGIGDQRIEQWQEAVTIGGESYMASAYRLYTLQTDQFESEFYIVLDVNGNLSIDFGVHKLGAPRSGQAVLSEAEFNEVRETIMQIVASLRFD
jgi:hypothetical protein